MARAMIKRPGTLLVLLTGLNLLNYLDRWLVAGGSLDPDANAGRHTTSAR